MPNPTIPYHETILRPFRVLIERPPEQDKICPLPPGSASVGSLSGCWMIGSRPIASSYSGGAPYMAAIRSDVPSNKARLPNYALATATAKRVWISVRSLRRKRSRSRSKLSMRDVRAARFAPTMRWLPSIASSMPIAPPSGGATATIHSRRNCSRKNRSSMARADLTVRAPVSACAPSESSGSMADTSKTAISLPSAPNTGAPEQQLMCGTE